MLVVAVSKFAQDLSDEGQHSEIYSSSGEKEATPGTVRSFLGKPRLERRDFLLRILKMNSGYEKRYDPLKFVEIDG